MFPFLFRDVVVSYFLCEVCQFAKYYRTSFPIKSIKCSKPFSLVHSDIWEPSKIPNIHGSRWLVTFIGDCTRPT